MNQRAQNFVVSVEKGRKGEQVITVGPVVLRCALPSKLRGAKAFQPCAWRRRHCSFPRFPVPKVSRLEATINPKEPRRSG